MNFKIVSAKQKKSVYWQITFFSRNNIVCSNTSFRRVEKFKIKLLTNKNGETLQKTNHFNSLNYLPQTKVSLLKRRYLNNHNELTIRTLSYLQLGKTWDKKHKQVGVLAIIASVIYRYCGSFFFIYKWNKRTQKRIHWHTSSYLSCSFALVKACCFTFWGEHKKNVSVFVYVYC